MILSLLTTYIQSHKSNAPKEKKIEIIYKCSTRIGFLYEVHHTPFKDYHTECKLGMNYCLTPFNLRFSTADAGLGLGVSFRVGSQNGTW